MTLIKPTDVNQLTLLCSQAVLCAASVEKGLQEKAKHRCPELEALVPDDELHF